MANFLLLMSLLTTITPVHSLSTCYYPDGTIETGHVPCNQTTTGSSACCSPSDSCSISGICLGASGWDYRGSCTDVSWGSTNCPATEWSQCLTDPSTKEKYNIFTPLWPCISEGVGGSTGGLASNWCCSYSDGSSCCDSSFVLGNTGLAFKPGNDAVLQSLTSASTNTASCTAASTNIITTTPTSAASKATSNKGDIGMKVGLGVGIPLGVLVAGLLGFLFWRESMKNHSIPATYSSNYSPPGPIYEAPPNAIHEMSSK